MSSHMKNEFRYFLRKILLVFIILTINYNHIAKGEGTENVCMNEGCNDAAKLIEANIDTTVEPCDDFFAFACGGYIKKANLTESQVGKKIAAKEKVRQTMKDILIKPVEDGESRIIKLVKYYYQACLDTTTINSLKLKPLREVLDQLGGWPVAIGDKWAEADFNWQDTYVKLRRLGFNMNYYFIYLSLPMTKNTEPDHNIKINNGQPFFLESEELVKANESEKVKAYYNYMVEIAVYLGSNKERAERELQEVLEFEKQLAEINLSDEVWDLGDLHTIADLENRLPSIPWLQFINNIIDPATPVDRTKGIEASLYHLETVQGLLNKVSNRTLANYMIWRCIAESIPHLDEDIKQKFLDFQTEYGLSITVNSRSNTCLNQLLDGKFAWPIAVGTLYVRSAIDPEIKPSAQFIMQNIIQQFESVIQQNTWMETAEQKQAIHTLKTIGSLIISPDEWLNDTILDQYVSNLNIEPLKHFQNVLNKQRFLYDNLLSRIHKSPGADWWMRFSKFADINAFYSAYAHRMDIMAGMLQPPIYDHRWPYFAKFSTLGVIIGHEIMHAFDFDRVDESIGHMSNKSSEEYNVNHNCFIRQYERYQSEINGPNHTTSNAQLNPTVLQQLPWLKNFYRNKAVDENVADTVGIKVSYLAYKKWASTNPAEGSLRNLQYTPEQLFWIMYANHFCTQETRSKSEQSSSTHLPDYLRVRGQLSNSKEFVNDFSCSTSAVMNAAEKCEMF